MRSKLTGIMRSLGTLVVLIFAGLFAYSFFAPPIVVTRSEAELQEILEKHLPHTFIKWGSDFTLERAKLKLTDTVTVEGSGSGHLNSPRRHRLISKFSASFNTTGTVHYRQDAFYFEPKGSITTEFALEGESPGAKMSKWGERLHSAGLRDVVELVAEKFDEKLPDLVSEGISAGLKRFPVYRVKNDAKGWIISASLEKLEMKEGQLFITFSLKQVTITMFVYLAVLMLAIVFTSIAVIHPELIILALF